MPNEAMMQATGEINQESTNPLSRLLGEGGLRTQASENQTENKGGIGGLISERFFTPMLNSLGNIFNLRGEAEGNLNPGESPKRNLARNAVDSLRSLTSKFFQDRIVMG